MSLENTGDSEEENGNGQGVVTSPKGGEARDSLANEVWSF